MKILLPFIFILSISNFTQAQEDQVSTLINLLYTVEDFSTRIGNTLDANETFAANSEDDYFMKVMMATARESALATYAQSIQTAVEQNFTTAEVDSLITVLNSPFGDVIRKAFIMDNQVIATDMNRYVATIVAESLDKQYERDGFLYTKSYPLDLKQVMDGNYINPLNYYGDVKIVRKKNNQTEYLGNEIVEYEVVWMTENRYGLVHKNKERLSYGVDTVVTNVYSVEGKTFKYICQFPDGKYYKGELIKENFNSSADEIKLFQAELNDSYRNPYTTPLSTEQLADFTNHSFYPVAEKYRVTAALEAFEQPETVEFATSSGQPAAYLRYGNVDFKIDGKKQQLTVFKSTREDEPANRLFIPFTDATSGEETYGGGRYVEAEFIENATTVIIDFNKAYQPYCVYSDNYSCPIPPTENALEIKIEAGVKL